MKIDELEQTCEKILEQIRKCRNLRRRQESYESVVCEFPLDETGRKAMLELLGASVDRQVKEIEFELDRIEIRRKSLL